MKFVVNQAMGHKYQDWDECLSFIVPAESLRVSLGMIRIFSIPSPIPFLLLNMLVRVGTGQEEMRRKIVGAYISTLGGFYVTQG